MKWRQRKVKRGYWDNPTHGSYAGMPSYLGQASQVSEKKDKRCKIAER